MGLNVASNLILGVRVERFVKETPVTKYDEDTGESYVKNVSEKAFRIVGTAIEVEMPDNYADYESDDGWFLGMRLGRTGSHWNEETWAVAEWPAEEKIEAVKSQLRKLGCDIEPQLFVYTYLSY